MARSLCAATALVVLAIAPFGALGQPYFVTVGESFGGSIFGIDSTFRAPDTMGAAGVDHYVELINGRFSVYRKSDGVRVQTSTLNQFWTSAGQAPTGNAFDPRVLYDPHARRWYAVAVDNGMNANSFLFGVSSSSDPTQPWTAFKIDSDTDDSNWADFPMIGYNPEAVFISANMPPLTAPNTRMAFMVLPKLSLLQPVPSIGGMTLLEDVPRPVGTNALSPQLTVDASNLFGVNTTLPVLMHDFTSGEVHRAEIVSPGSPSVSYVGQVGVPAAANPPTVDQPGPKQNLEANDGRFSANAVLHNGQIYAVQSVDDGGLAAVRFLRIDAATNAVLESQTIVDPVGRALTFPSIAVNEFGDTVIGVSGTSTSEFASSYAMVGKTAGGITTFDPPMLLRAGVSDYQQLMGGLNRWGDYSATTVDPADPGIFWTSQEFVVATDTWSTQVTELIVPQTNEARWGEYTGGPFDDPTLWRTSHGGAPLSTDDVIFSRGIDPSGISTTVVFPPQPAGVYVHHSASIRQGNVWLDLGGSQWDLTRHLEVGPYNGQPQATLANGALTSTAGFIAGRATSEGHLTLDNAQWTVTGHLHVGSAPEPGAVGVPFAPGANGGTGTLTIDNNSRVDVLDDPLSGAVGTLTIWERGEVNLFDGVLKATVIDQPAPPGPGSGLQFNGGTLHVDTFNGELFNNGGTLAPGGSIGVTNVLLSYFQRSGASLAIDIGGIGAAQFDRLVVGGLAVFDGTLDVSLLAGYMPTLGDTFPIVQAILIPLPGYANLLANSTFPTISSRLALHLFYEPTLLTLAIMPALTGDFNGDGAVDAADYVVWRMLSGQMGIGLAADSNFDGVVDFIDYLAWRSNYGQSVPGAGSGGGFAVPEPASVLLVALALLILQPNRARRSRSPA
jgi:hypothetical protein